MKSFFSPYSTPARLLLGGATALSLLACDPDDDAVEPVEPATVTNTVFIVNEGNFLRSNAEISSYSKTNRALLNKNLFEDVNNRPLGDVAQNMAVQDSTAYIVVNNSNKVEVTRFPSLRSIATISGLALPRYFAAASADKGYVTETVSYSAAAGRVSVLNLRTNAVIRTIAVGSQPERLLVADGHLYVTNNGGNTVTVINTSTDVVEGTITVGDAPNSLVLDRNNRVWVLSGGRVAYNPDYTVDYTRTTPGSLASIVPGQLTATTRAFSSNRSAPGRLSINGAKDQLYYTYSGGVYSLGVADATLPTTPLIRRGFYGLGIDPQDGTIYGGVASFTAADKVIRYRTNGTAIDSFTVNIGPNGFVFY